MDWTSIVVAFVCTMIVGGLAFAVLWERRNLMKFKQSAFDVLAKGVDHEQKPPRE